MARSVPISTILAEVTPYWEPALWVLIVVVTAGVVGSALWAPSRSGRRRGQRKAVRRSDAKARREERKAVAATMVAAPADTVSVSSSAEVSAGSEPHAEDSRPIDVDAAAQAVAHREPARSDVVQDFPEAAPAEPAPMLYDQAAVAATASSVPLEAPPTEGPLADVAPTAVPPTDVPSVDEPAPAPAASNGAVPPARHLESLGQPDPVPVPDPVVYADVEAGFSRLTSDIAALDGQVTFFGDRSNVPPEMPTWPIEHQQALADRAAEALAEPVDELLEHSLAVASDVRALDRLLGGRPHDDRIADAVVAQCSGLDSLRPALAHIQQRFVVLAGDFAVLAGTSEQLAKVASIIDATDAVMRSWEPLAVEPARTAAAHR